MDSHVKQLRKSFLHMLPTGTRIANREYGTYTFHPPQGRVWAERTINLDLREQEYLDKENYLPNWFRKNSNIFRML